MLMNSCKWCDASGWFHSLTDNELCKDCNLRIVNRVQIHARVLRRSIRDLRETDALEAKIRLARRIEQEARALQPFEDKGIRTLTPHPGDIADQFSTFHEQLLDARDAERNLSSGSLAVETPDITSIGVADAMDPLGTWEENVAVS